MTVSVPSIAALGRRLLVMGRRRIAGLMAFSAAAGLAEGMGVLALPPILKMLGVGGAGAAADHGLLLAVAGYVLLVCAAALVVRARFLAVQRLSQDFADRLRSQLHDAVLAMEWARFRGLRSGELQQAIAGESARIGHMVTMAMALAGALCSIPFVLAAALALSPAMTLSVLAAAGLVVLVTRGLGRAGFRLTHHLVTVNRTAMADLADDLAGMRAIKGFGGEPARAAQVNAGFATLRAAQRAYDRLNANERAALRVAAALAVAVALYLSITVFQVPLADALVLILAYGRLVQTALNGLSNWRQLTAGMAILAAHDETLAMCRQAAEPVDMTPIPPPFRAIRLRGVRVVYPAVEGGPAAEGGQAGLDGIDADIPAGKVTAVIGPSGAGKSTLADLVAGLTTPDEGAVWIDDVCLAPERRRAWRQQTAVVSQDPFLFHDTIAANLRLGRPEAGDDALWDALEQAAAADFVRALPAGLETVVGDRGARLSGGERQRIVLARALLRRPALLVLDEATAALDAATEAAVARALVGLRGNCTMLVVAHRPSTVRAADHVLLLEGGRLVAAGNWQTVRQTAADRIAALGMMGGRDV